MRLADELREQGRGMAGALLVLGISFGYTIETWRLAVDIPTVHLLGFVVVGLALVVVITNTVGFRSDEADDETDDETDDPGQQAGSPLWVEFLEVVFQSFVIGYTMLFLLGVVDTRMTFPVFLRTGLVQVVPLAFGAALANELLSGDQEEFRELGFPRYLGVFALGAVFFAAPLAPTEEIAVIAEQVSWGRLGVLLLATLVVTYLMLYELEFRGQSRRLQDRSRRRQFGQTCTVAVVGLVVAFWLLVALGGIDSEPFGTWVRQTVVLAFPAAIGASGARVILG